MIKIFGSVDLLLEFWERYTILNIGKDKPLIYLNAG